MADEKSSWRSAFDSIKEKADQLTDDPRAKSVLRSAKSGASTTVRKVGDARRGFTQEEAWAEATELFDELVDVVRTQHALLIALDERVRALEVGERSRAVD